ncbi:membrane protein required for colicin V production [Loktanella sp. DSM 29012]|uniref:CvpA family protein n=1 Tax=Loktanella gaetbuli TaxID=2881335 RepID=A0ABS8BRJ1_9RHOB|nr:MULTISPECIES: CvpA family protein [Loktanella]KQI68762.1 colicin V production CvpA [Loktanella sp. 3ANDIMAR09]MCB5198350.1 CvpA family protein [Loktanella gaetbuli]SEQ67654.1 membrane protein required for colicin V production [Loktanella sp. DSM 29012]
MDGFTIIDGIVAATIVISALLAYSRGLVREAMAIAGWIGATILAFLFAGQAEPLVRQIPVLGDFIGDSCELSIIAAFAVVFAVALVVVSIFTPLFSSVIQRSALNGLDQGLGFLFGVARGVLLVTVAFFVYQTVLSAQDIAMVEDSRSARIFTQFGGTLEDRDPEAALGWITSQYAALIGECGATTDVQ